MNKESVRQQAAARKQKIVWLTKTGVILFGTAALAGWAALLVR